jgi:hypothetical protein
MWMGVSTECGSALAFYRRFGLEPTGKIADGEMILAAPVPMA